VFDDTTQAIADRSFPVSSIAFALTEDTLLRRFNLYYETLTADTPERVRLAQMVRYQVYCVENPLEVEACPGNPTGVESDDFDSHAVHSLIVRRATGDALGTTRLILPLADAPERSFAVQRLLDAGSAGILLSLPHRSTAEVSRFSISRQFRRRITGISAGPNQPGSESGNSCGPLVRLGLIQGLVRMSMEQRITHWCALMEPTLLRMLNAMAIRFRPIGPLVQFRGLRQPCYIVLSDMLKAVKRERPAFWEVLTDGGSLLECAPAG